MPRSRGKPDVFCAEVNICVFLLVTVCSLNVLSTFIPIKSESILSVCFVFINKKRTKRDGAKYMFIVHTTCNVFKRWQYILKIKRYLTNAPQQTILTRTPPTPILSSNCQNNRSRLEQTAETDNFFICSCLCNHFPRENVKLEF